MCAGKSRNDSVVATRSRAGRAVGNASSHAGARLHVLRGCWRCPVSTAACLRPRAAAAVSAQSMPDAFALIDPGCPAPVLLDDADFPGVACVAGDLRTDSTAMAGRDAAATNLRAAADAASQAPFSMAGDPGARVPGRRTAERSARRRDGRLHQHPSARTGDAITGRGVEAPSRSPAAHRISRSSDGRAIVGDSAAIVASDRRGSIIARRARTAPASRRRSRRRRRC